MAEPVKKIDNSQNSGQPLKLVAEYQDNNDNIIEFEKYLKERQNARELNQGKLNDKREAQKEPSTEEEPLSPEEKAAKHNREGAPMAESGGGTLSGGGSGSLNPLGNPTENPDTNIGEEKKESTNQNQSPQDQQKKSSQEESEKQQQESQQTQENQSGTEDTPVQADQDEPAPQTQEQQMRQELKKQRAGLDESRNKMEDTKKKRDSLDENKKFRRILANRKLKSQEKDIKRKQLALAKAKKELIRHIKIKELLRQSWLNIIETFGLTWFYIAFHFLNAYFTPWGNLFCRFGEEWLPAEAEKAIEKNQAGAAAKKAAELAEMAGCVLIGLLLFVIILIIITLFLLLIYIWENPISFAAQMGWEALKASAGAIIGI